MAKKDASFSQKESIIKRLNERIASIVRKVGLNNEDVNRWTSKLTRPRSPYATKVNKYDPSKVKLARNKGITGPVDFVQLSRKKSDIAAMNLEDLERLESQTRGWGEVKKEAKKALVEQRKLDENPFTRDMPITDQDVSDYLDQKEKVRQFIEGNSDAFYALIEATGWDDIRDHTTEEIYNEIQKLDMAAYEFSGTLSEIGEAYIQRRDAARARREELDIL